MSWLAPVLKALMCDHPEVDLELTIALSGTLIARFDAGDLDVVLCKRWPGEDRGELVWRDEVVWVGSAAEFSLRGGPVPLILYPPPSIARSITLAALGKAEAPWRIACTSDTLSGVVAAAQAGLGVAVLARKLIPAGLVEIPENAALPPLGSLDFILLRSPRAPREPVAELCATIVDKATQG